MGFHKIHVIFTLVSIISWLQNLDLAVCVKFEVGGDRGWKLPPSNDTDFYNDWASHNRFQVTDTLHFTYKKDSVMVVEKEEYEKCLSSRPKFYSNAGSTGYILNKPGPFYFISGTSGHCDKGLKMIVEVLDSDSRPPSSDHQVVNNDTASTTTREKSGGGALLDMASAGTHAFIGLLLFSFFVY